MMPAPSPVFCSAPRAPRWSRRISADRPLATTSWERRPCRSATKATPQASRSEDGSYSPRFCCSAAGRLGPWGCGYATGPPVVAGVSYQGRDDVGPAKSLESTLRGTDLRQFGWITLGSGRTGTHGGNLLRGAPLRHSVVSRGGDPEFRRLRQARAVLRRSPPTLRTCGGLRGACALHPRGRGVALLRPAPDRGGDAICCRYYRRSP